jgi:hypothetical protein
MTYGSHLRVDELLVQLAFCATRRPYAVVLPGGGLTP